MGIKIKITKCPLCKGEGKIDNEECEVCQGTGVPIFDDEYYQIHNSFASDDDYYEDVDE